jgi:hypothetical protein
MISGKNHLVSVILNDERGNEEGTHKLIWEGLIGRL